MTAAEPRSLIGLPERRAAQRRFNRASSTFDAADAVHGEARGRLLERLKFFKLTPRCVVDLGAATGRASVELAAAFPRARVVTLDLSQSMIRTAARRCASVDHVTAVVGDAERLPFADGTVDVIFANLLLPWCDPQVVFAEAARVLAEGGLLLFTSVGPDTLQEVRRAWAQVDDAIHVHGFIDMHDLGDLLGRAGLAEPVMDVDRLRVTYPEVERLVEDLRACGATNVAHGRRVPMTGSGRWGAFCDRLNAKRTGNELAISVELIFGQAWGTGGVGRQLAEDGTVGISVEEMTRKLRGLGLTRGGI